MQRIVEATATPERVISAKRRTTGALFYSLPRSRFAVIAVVRGADHVR
jgi:hypothetical protein